jgi:hypothetical protein
MTTVRTLAAGDGLTLHLDAPHWRVAWHEPDWLGPLGFFAHHAGHWYEGSGAAPAHDIEAHHLQPDLQAFDGGDDIGTYHGVALHWHALPAPLRTTVRGYTDRALLVFRIEARGTVGAGTPAVTTGSFAEPSVAWPYCLPAQRLAGGIPLDTRTYGHQYTEFALPVGGDAECTGFVLAPHRPAVVEPLLFIGPDGRTLMLAPLDRFHEQIIAVPGTQGRLHDGIRCGWHGDLRDVPAGFATEMAVWGAESPRQALTAWAEVLRRRHRTQRPSRYADDLLGKLSYWTDNGAVYYYRTEPGCDYATTLEKVVRDLEARHVPVSAVQIDSWFYPHQDPRPVSAEGAPIVPPSGMMRWEPRADIFPDGLHALRRRLGGRPLAFHSRHFSARSPYFEVYEAWRDGESAHPAGPELLAQLLAQAAAWGAVTYEQDWMVESFLGVRGLREAPGRAQAWQEGLDRAADEHGLSLQWCMSSPADFMQTVTLRRLASIRTSGDYRYLFDNGLNWVWFLHSNALARALGLNPYKDVFLSHGATAMSPGEPYAEVESLMAALSAGPVGIGDQLGHCTRDIVMRTCRADGVLIKPDVPIAAIDRCFRANAFLEPSLLVGETYSLHPAGRWLYVASFNAYRDKQPLSGRIALPELGALQPETAVVAYDWRRRTWTRLEADAAWEITLPFQEWDFRVLCPVLPGEVTVFGDVSKYATVGDRRIAGIRVADGALVFDVLGAPDTVVEVQGWASTEPAAITAWVPGNTRVLRREAAAPADTWDWRAADGRWVVRVALTAQGQTRVAMPLRTR